MGLRAILVSVDYDDLLDITLPYNRHHFDEVMVVTAPKKPDTEIAKTHGAEVFVTDAFYRNGAKFNKWLSLELALDKFGREGWLCIMDADVLWPKDLQWRESKISREEWQTDTHILELSYSLGNGYRAISALVEGCLYTPLRLMVPIRDAVNIEWCWKNSHQYQIHRNINEWAGYSQIFHASDQVLGEPPWHETNWIHAGGADSFFQNKWSRDKKVRPPFECLHLGQAGENWFGRASARLDGTMPVDADRKRTAVEAIWTGRRRNRAEGRDQFTGEKLVPKHQCRGCVYCNAYGDAWKYNEECDGSGWIY